MDATKRPLLIPNEFSTYAEEHGVFEICKSLLEELLIHKPEDPISFLIDALKRENSDVPQVIIVGPPASGKRTISKLVSSRLGCAHIVPEKLLQEANTGLRLEAEKYQQQKKEIPPDLWARAIDERLKMFDCVKKGWVLDSFPKTREQALALQAKGIYPKHFVQLEAEDTVLIERADGKRVDPQTGDVYHTTFDWPSSSDVAKRLTEPEAYSETEIAEKLVTFHRHAESLTTSFKSVHKLINADQPKTDVFAQVLTFLSKKPRSAAPHTPRVIILGPTGSGKSVQAALLASKYNIVHVSCGKLIKQAIAEETKVGLSCKPYVDQGVPVPDAIVLDILKERLGQLDCASRGWVLHSYPKTREQAEQLAHAGFVPNRVFFLDVPGDSVVERLTLRATDPLTGDRYHMLYNPPRTREIKQRLSVNPKDNANEVQKRLQEYNSYSEELSDYYEDAQHVNADQDPHTVFESLESLIVNQQSRKL